MPSLDPRSEQQSTSSATSHSALAARASLVPPLMLMALLPLGMAYGLYLEGRPWWCACRLPFLWTSDINSRHCSQHLFDPYSFTHLLHGVVFCGALAWLLPRLFVRWRFVAALAVEALWELVENSDFVINRYRTATMALGYEGDSIANSLGDLLACGIGFMIAMRLGWKRSLILFVVTELLLIIWIRDSLFLSALMLIHSFDAIKAWQQGG